MPVTKASSRVPTPVANTTPPPAASVAAAPAPAPKPAPAGDQFVVHSFVLKNAAPPAPSTSVPTTVEDLKKQFPELKYMNKESAKAVLDSMQKLATGSAAEKLDALATLSKTFPDSIGSLLTKLGIADNKLAKLSTNKEALAALAVLGDPKKNAAERAKGALDFAKLAGDVYAPKELQGVLKGALDALPAGSALAGAIGAFMDPTKTGPAKAKATLELASALKSFAGTRAPQLANDLRKLNGSMRAAGNALTLLDSEATAKDKALAGAQLLAEVPDLKKDLAAFKKFVEGGGAKDADELMKAMAVVGEVKVKGLDPRLAQKLSPADTARLQKLAERVTPEKLEPVLRALSNDPAALAALEKKLATLDDKAAGHLLTTVGGLESEVLQQALKDPHLLDTLGKLAGKLDAKTGEAVAKLVKDFDHGALKALGRFTEQMTADELAGSLKLIGPIVEAGNSKLTGKLFKGLEKLLDKMGVKLTGEAAMKALKTVGKLAPGVGTIPNAIDAAKFAKEAVDLRDQNKDLGFLAVSIAGLNVADAAVGLILDATGVGVAGDVVASLGFGAVELALEIGFDAEKAKMQKDPKNYKAPDWVKGVNVAYAASMGPLGVGALAAYYGPEGAAQLVQWGVEKAAKGGIALAKQAGISSAEFAGDGLKASGKMLHQLADVIRNPKKYGQKAVEAARDALDAVVSAGGKLAGEAKAAISDAVSALKDLGEQGIEALTWLAKNPGEAAKAALDGLKDLAGKGLDLATDAGKALYKKATQAIEGLKAGWENLKGNAKELAKDLVAGAGRALETGMKKAIELGEKAIDVVAWAATHPGEVGRMAKEATLSALKAGGALAKKAWESVSSAAQAAGRAGVAFAKEAVSALKNAGEAAVETLRYIANNPGKALSQATQWVGDTLSSIVKSGGAAAKKAAIAIKDFIDNRVTWAIGFGKDLIKDGAKAFLDVAKAWKDNITEGAKAVFDGLQDLGAAGVDALKDLAGIGGQAAEYAVGKLKNLADAGIDAAEDALDALVDLGGEIGDFAKSALDSPAGKYGKYVVLGPAAVLLDIF
ncbi:MAG: Dauer Up-regulated [Archangium sp.]